MSNYGIMKMYLLSYNRGHAFIKILHPFFCISFLVYKIRGSNQVNEICSLLSVELRFQLCLSI